MEATLDLGSSVERRTGSSPVPPTTFIFAMITAPYAAGTMRARLSFNDIQY